ncbi:MAG: Fe-S cluster assembly ATPase SufC [Acidimicrobiia bacterium]|nr:Fe-S cluster assembly ATPase SufC [Acidimicrobiia bacterium]
MSKLVVSGLRAAVGGQEILRGVDLEVESGQVHAVMGPNGSGKSTLAHVIMGKPGYEVLGGSVTLDGTDLLALPTWQRAQAGLFLALQYPTEVPGVPLELALAEALHARANGEAQDVHQLLADEAERVGLDARFLDRPLNVDFSGGEKKRNETVQLGVLRPKIALLDEIDSGLGIDALRAVSRRVEEETRDNNLGVLVITHYSRVLRELHPDVVSVLRKGRLVASGGPELADELERTGYAGYDDDEQERHQTQAAPPSGAPPDPFADPLL